MPWRVAHPADDEAIVARCLGLYHEDPSEVPVPEAHIRATLAALRREPGRGDVVVLDEAGGVCGFALLISFWSNEVGGEICVVDELYVDAGARGRGHARALIESLLRGEGRWAGIVGLELEVSPDNVRARALYEDLGFRDIKNATMRVRRSSAAHDRPTGSG